MSSIFAEHLLSCMIAVPFLGIAILAFVPSTEWIRRIALANTLLNLGLAVLLWSRFDSAKQGMQFVERAEWMPTFNIQYAVGVDGISILLVLLTALLSPLCVLCSWNAIDTRVRAFMSLILLVEGAMIVVFTALDLFLFFMAWEITMIPMYFLIILWGGPGRIAAGIKFVLYSLTGSLLLARGDSGIVLGRRTHLRHSHADGTDLSIQCAVLDLLSVPSSLRHQVADGPFSLVAAGCPFGSSHRRQRYPGRGAVEDGWVWLLAVLSPNASRSFRNLCTLYSYGYRLAAILYGGYLALAQSDLKKLVAYSSISHMGFVTLGIFAFNRQGIQGAVLQMFNHGITTGALFLAVGQLYDRTHSRLIGDYGGLHKPMPRFAAFLCLFSVAAFGLPGAANFIGEFLVLVGTSYRSFVMVLLAMGGIVLAAAYMLWMLQRVTLGAGSNARGCAASRSQLAGNRNPCATGYCDSWGGSLSGPPYGNNGRQRDPSRAEDERRPAAQGDETRLTPL